MAAASKFSLARRLRAGDTVYSAWCGLPSASVAEAIAREGFSAVSLDQQHGLWDTASTMQTISAIHLAGSAPIVRVPLRQNAMVSRALDFGAEGVIAPMISCAEDAREFANAAKYPPIGERSLGAHRAAALAGFADQRPYLPIANEETLAFAMIETRASLDNADAIINTPGIDGLFIGPSDLSYSLTNGAVLDAHSDEVEKGLEIVLKACRNAGKIPGLYCVDGARAAAKAKAGFRFLAIGSDLAFLRAGTAAQLKALQ